MRFDGKNSVKLDTAWNFVKSVWYSSSPQILRQ